MFCSQCGQNNTSNSTFCSNCGHNLKPSNFQQNQPEQFEQPNNGYTQPGQFEQPNNGYTQPGQFEQPNNGYTQPGQFKQPNGAQSKTDIVKPVKNKKKMKKQKKIGILAVSLVAILIVGCGAAFGVYYSVPEVSLAMALTNTQNEISSEFSNIVKDVSLFNVLEDFEKSTYSIAFSEEKLYSSDYKIIENKVSFNYDLQNIRLESSYEQGEFYYGSRIESFSDYFKLIYSEDTFTIEFDSNYNFCFDGVYGINYNTWLTDYNNSDWVYEFGEIGSSNSLNFIDLLEDFNEQYNELNSTFIDIILEEITLEKDGTEKLKIDGSNVEATVYGLDITNETLTDILYEMKAALLKSSLLDEDDGVLYIIADYFYETLISAGIDEFNSTDDLIDYFADELDYYIEEITEELEYEFNGLDGFEIYVYKNTIVGLALLVDDGDDAWTLTCSSVKNLFEEIVFTNSMYSEEWVINLEYDVDDFEFTIVINNNYYSDFVLIDIEVSSNDATIIFDGQEIDCVISSSGDKITLSFTDEWSSIDRIYTITIEKEDDDDIFDQKNYENIFDMDIDDFDDMITYLMYNFNY